MVEGVQKLQFGWSRAVAAVHRSKLIDMSAAVKAGDEESIKVVETGLDGFINDNVHGWQRARAEQSEACIHSMRKMIG